MSKRKLYKFKAFPGCVIDLGAITYISEASVRGYNNNEYGFEIRLAGVPLRLSLEFEGELPEDWDERFKRKLPAVDEERARLLKEWEFYALMSNNIVKE